jgi:hypothetical protein
MLARMRGIGSITLLLAATAAGPVLAAQVFVQNTASVGAETNSNLDLTPGGDSETTGYIVNASSLIGIATPNSSTTIRPRVDYRNYPTDSADDRVEAYVDFNSAYRSQRTTAGIYGTLDHRDELNAEMTQAVYDEVNPVYPTAPQTGRTVRGITRDSAILLPSYSYNLGQLLAVGLSGIYEKFGYSPEDDSRYVDFTYYQAKASLIWTLNQKSDLSFGAYGNKYSATHFDSTANATGGSLELNTSWTQLFSTRASVVLQHSSIDSGIPPIFNGTVNAWGGALTAIYKTETNQFRADLSRNLTPSGGGSVYYNNQLQFEYSRKITARLAVTTAAVYLQNRAMTAAVSDNGRNYLRSVVDVKWMMSRLWFVQGGYQYTWQKYQLDPDGAANNRIYLRFGYQGLGRQW